MDVKEKVLDAIQLLTAASVEKAGYDRTIQAQIVSCEDATIGKYRCRYQDSTFYAYANNTDMTFNNNSYVYILVPGNDFKKEKTILGTTSKLGINYISQAEGDQAYDLIGTNCIDASQVYYLNTNNNNYKWSIYTHNGATNGIELNTTSLDQYIKSSSSLIVGATFKTSIAPQRQFRGHYGIAYNLRFRDNASDREVIRSYVVDEDNMVDNPYRLAFETRQYQIFDIDGQNFIRVESIDIFNKDFPGATGNATTGRLNSGDIQISKLELTGAVKMSENEINGVAISFFTPQGTFFTEYSTNAQSKMIVAQVKVKGKLVSSAQKIPFYWGKQNVKITPSSNLYNKQLGRGWQCLNDKNDVIIKETDMQDPVVEWIPGKDTYIVKYEDAISRDNRYKVAIIYDNTVITKQINIQNLAAGAYQVTITSDGGTQFYYDIGHPTLTCRAKTNGVTQTGCTYYWAYQSDTRVLTDLPVTTSLNTQYDNAVAALESLQTDIANGVKFKKKQENTLAQLQSQVESFKFIQRVKGSRIFDVQIKNITNRGTFKCSVYKNGVYLGTGAITLTNTLDGEDVYSLVINNGSATFQYNENGVAPTNGSLDVPQQIEALSFTVYDNLGNPIDSNDILRASGCLIRWEFPIKDTLLVDSGNQNSSGTDAAQQYKYYDNALLLTYKIQNIYDINKKRNQIRLNVKYKGMNLTAETSFTFVKQGQPGTNGTEFIVKLVPNTAMDDPPLWPMITKAGSKYYLNYGIGTHSSQQEISYGSGNAYQFFKAQLWHNGEMVWQGASINDAAADGVTKPTAVHWEVLKNKYTSTVSDASAFAISSANAGSGRFYYTGDHLQNAYSTPLANIIKCSVTWQDKLYYGTIPVTTAWTSNQKFRVSLKDYTGFRYVIYTSDGMTPQEDSSHPFEFICQETIDGVLEDVSLVSGSHAITFTPSSCGNIFDEMDGNNNPTYVNTNLLKLMDETWYRRQVEKRQSSASADQLQKNQWVYKPASRYDGQCVNAAVLCSFSQNGSVIGKINVPIHFLLNKYGLAHINAWDGNSVQIDEEGGYILAPQMGAGVKNSHNDFTGVLMGQVRAAGKKNPDIGLLGYAQGDRTFFINSKNGSAIFGKSEGGQIIIDPRTINGKNNRALLYSSNFWKVSNYGEDGLPISYNSSGKRGEGMLIDLSTPEIRWGNKNFSVNQNGYLTARGGGQIAGWLIGYYTLTAKDNSITLQAAQLTDPSSEYNATTNPYLPANIHSDSHTSLTDTDNGFYVGKDGLSIGSLFKVTNEGVLTLGRGAVSGANNRHWTINASGSGTSAKSYISYNASSFANVISQDTQEQNPIKSVYIGTDGISLGTRFSVNDEGKVEIRRGSIDMGTVTGMKYIVTDGNGNLSLGTNGQVQLQTYSSAQPLFHVENFPTSALTMNIKNGNINLGNNFIVDNQGHMYANSGQIGGFVINTHPTTGFKYLACKTDHLAAGTSEIVNNAPINGIYLGTDGLSLGRGFSVTSEGITNIRDGAISLGGGAFYVDRNGQLTATSGSIGGIQIYSGQLLGGIRDENTHALQSGFSLRSNGNIQIGPTGNRWQFKGTGGLAQDGDLEGINNNVLKCKIQPGFGMAKFTNLDVIEKISVGETLQGINGLNFNGNGNQTFSINATNGAASFSSVSTGSLTLNNQAITSSGPGQLSVGGTPIVAVFG